MEIAFHRPVLVEAVLQFLPTVPDGVYVDGTLGGGGHAEAIVTQLSARGRLIGFDLDATALTVARQRLGRFEQRVEYIHDNVANLRSILETKGIDLVDGVLLDLGISSHQIDEADRGFSFQQNSRLDMRMDRSRELDGWTVVNTYSQDRLANIFWSYGEERHSRRIARRIVSVRQHGPIETTGDLANLVRSVVGEKFLQKTLARIFQSIRIEVNRELENLPDILRDSIELLRPGGRIVVVAYHSLEDRIVKDFFREQSRGFIPSNNRFLPDKPHSARLRVLTSKPIVAGAQEVQQNPRARSAKLRAAERI